MQSTVLDIFPRDKILTPREVKGDFETLTDAVRLTTVTAPKETADDRNGDLDGPLFSQWGRRHSAEEGPDGPGEGSSSSLNGLNSDPFAGPGYRDVSTAPGASTVPNGISDSSDISGGGEGLSSGSGSGIHDSTHSGVAANLAGVTEGLGRGEGVVGGWPLVDETRGMALFVIDYQSQNVACRPAVRKVINCRMGGKGMVKTTHRMKQRSQSKMSGVTPFNCDFANLLLQTLPYTLHERRWMFGCLMIVTISSISRYALELSSNRMGCPGT